MEALHVQYKSLDLSKWINVPASSSSPIPQRQSSRRVTRGFQGRQSQGHNLQDRDTNAAPDSRSWH